MFQEQSGHPWLGPWPATDSTCHIRTGGGGGAGAGGTKRGGSQDGAQGK